MQFVLIVTSMDAVLGGTWLTAVELVQEPVPIATPVQLGRSNQDVGALLQDHVVIAAQGHLQLQHHLPAPHVLKVHFLMQEQHHAPHVVQIHILVQGQHHASLALAMLETTGNLHVVGRLLEHAPPVRVTHFRLQLEFPNAHRARHKRLAAPTSTGQVVGAVQQGHAQIAVFVQQDSSDPDTCTAGNYCPAGNGAPIPCGTCTGNNYWQTACGGASAGNCTSCPACLAGTFRSGCSGKSPGSCRTC